MKKITPLFLMLCLFAVSAVAQDSLSVEKIMRDPSWMGTFPSNVRWDQQGKTIYFNYNKENDPSDSLYKINLAKQGTIEKVGIPELKSIMPSNTSDNKKKTKKVYSQRGELFIYDIASDTKTSLLSLGNEISNPKFLAKDEKIGFEYEDNLFVFDTGTGRLEKLTNIKEGKEPETKEEKADARGEWLKNENIGLLEVIKERENKNEEAKAYREAVEDPETFSFYSGSKQVNNLQLSPDEKYATFSLITRGEIKNTFVPDFTDASGYTTNLSTRSKVGDEPSKVEMAIYDIKRDSVYMVTTDSLPGITELPDYVADYPDRNWEKEVRDLYLSGPYFSIDGKKAVVNIRSVDNKDRWIASLDLTDGSLKTLDRQRDEAWIGGPGIGYSFGGGTLGWLPDNTHIYFQSEETGYSHLYILNVSDGSKKPLTSGQFEVFDPFISKDDKSWYLTTSEVDPGERHFYKMPLMGGNMQKLTSMTGNNDVTLSPDEKNIAILHSYSNQPWELYLKENAAKGTPKQLTFGQSEEFKACDWRDPQLVHFTAEDGVQIPARLYLPEESKNKGAAVIFVHGAGYLQNVHKWWSSYFREYMFHNLLTDLGYTVLDIDYRGSAGYGRDWRTAIYRHMGGKDLSDQVDGANYLMETHGVEPGKIGIYGGSYGGFITLMALFNEAETFTSGAALRSVTDWAHYNHGYTSNILNEPFNDPIAYKRSSPIYFAAGLEGNLLMAHGMIDTNVHFQDIVRLTQRFIELGKENWELAVYPVEDHGFAEPSSWTDEYGRILKLFNDTLVK